MSLATTAIVLAGIFTAGLPDKTALASLILGSRYRLGWVFVGAAGAFAVHVGPRMELHAPPRPCPGCADTVRQEGLRPTPAPGRAAGRVLHP